MDYKKVSILGTTGAILIILALATLNLEDYRTLLTDNPDKTFILIDYNSKQSLEFITRGANWATNKDILLWKFNKDKFSLYSNDTLGISEDTYIYNNKTKSISIYYYILNTNNIVISRVKKYNTGMLSQFFTVNDSSDYTEFPVSNVITWEPKSNKVNYRVVWSITDFTPLPFQKTGVLEDCQIDFAYNMKANWCNEISKVDEARLDVEKHTLTIYFKKSKGFQTYRVRATDPPGTDLTISNFKFNGLTTGTFENDVTYPFTFDVNSDGNYVNTILYYSKVSGAEQTAIVDLNLAEKGTRTLTSLGSIGGAIYSFEELDDNLFIGHSVASSIPNLATYNSISGISTNITLVGAWGSAINAMKKYDGNLYTGQNDGNLGSYNNTTKSWKYIQTLSGIRDIEIYDTNLYTASSDGNFGTYNSTSNIWTLIGTNGTGIYDLEEYDGNLYSSDSAGVLKVYNSAGNDWNVLIDIGTTVRVLKKYDGNLYTGDQAGNIGTYNKDSNTWTLLADIGGAIGSMEVFDNNLFITTVTTIKTYNSKSNNFTTIGTAGSYSHSYDGNIFYSNVGGTLASYGPYLKYCNEIEDFNILHNCKYNWTPTGLSNGLYYFDLNTHFTDDNSGIKKSSIGPFHLGYLNTELLQPNGNQRITGTYDIKFKVSSDLNYLDANLFYSTNKGTSQHKIVDLNLAEKSTSRSSIRDKHNLSNYPTVMVVQDKNLYIGTQATGSGGDLYTYNVDDDNVTLIYNGNDTMLIDFIVSKDGNIFYGYGLLDGNVYAYNPTTKINSLMRTFDPFYGAGRNAVVFDNNIFTILADGSIIDYNNLDNTFTDITDITASIPRDAIIYDSNIFYLTDNGQIITYNNTSKLSSIITTITGKALYCGIVNDGNLVIVSSDGIIYDYNNRTKSYSISATTSTAIYAGSEGECMELYDSNIVIGANTGNLINYNPKNKTYSIISGLGIVTSIKKYAGYIYFGVNAVNPRLGRYGPYYKYCSNWDNFNQDVNCTYSWDTTAATDGNWFIDINVTTTGINDRNSDSSDYNFEIDNFEFYVYNVIDNYLSDVNSMELRPSAYIDYNIVPNGQNDTNGYFKIIHDASADLNICIDLNVSLPSDSNMCINIDNNKKTGCLDVNEDSPAHILTNWAVDQNAFAWVWFDLNLMDVIGDTFILDYNFYSGC